jgi:peptidoglycan/LPS O-acetylase OafA/YrhL
MRRLTKASLAARSDSVENQVIPDTNREHSFDDLARRDQPAQYFPAIDGVRGIMAISIILVHVNRAWFPGAPTVMDIFFVISGFLITLLLLKNIQRQGHIELKKFWVRRIKRLYPLLIIVVGTYLLLGSLLIDQPAQLYVDGVQTLLYVSNWTKLYDYIYPSYFGHSWSLSVEEQFYLLWPLGLSLMLRWRISRKWVITLCLLLIGITITWRSHLIDMAVPWSRIYYASDTRVDAFLLGGILAMTWQRWHTSWYQKRWLNVASQACFVLLVVTVMVWDPWQVQYFVWHQSAIILLSCGTIIALASPLDSPLKSLLSLPPLRQLGLMCYGIYLWHWPMIWLLLVRFHLRPLAILCVVLPTTLALAYLTYRYVEAPILSRRSKAA